MLEAPEVEPHVHHHKTGHSKLDMIFASLAIVLSTVSIVVAMHHGNTMEKLVQANTWPNLSYATGNQDDAGHQLINFEIKNTGVGPARIETFEVFYKDQPVHEGSELLAACCTKKKTFLATSFLNGTVLPAREAVEFITMLPDHDPDAWAKLNLERFHVRVRACYCSVFDDCYVMDSSKRRPERVDQCAPSQPIQYP